MARAFLMLALDPAAKVFIMRRQMRVLGLGLFAAP
jgi:hypothetical protein